VAGISLRNGRYFVARRLPGGAMGSKWEFPGGKVEEGEGQVAALKREYMEEFGVEVSVLMPICEVSFRNGEKDYALHAYFIDIGNQPLMLNEHSECAWASLEEILRLDFADSDKKILPFLI